MVLEFLVESKGHWLLMSPRCHPVLSGVGIEYSLGKRRMVFRRNRNDENLKNLRLNMEKDLNTAALLTVPRWRHFASSACDHLRVQAILVGAEAEMIVLSEKSLKGSHW